MLQTNHKHMSLRMTKQPKWPMRHAKAQISLGIRPVWSEYSLSAWRKVVSLATHTAHSDDWSDWADSRADLSLPWAYMSFCWFCHIAAQINQTTCWQTVYLQKFWKLQFWLFWKRACILLFEPQHGKTNKMTCAPSEDSDQAGHPPILIRVFAVRSIGGHPGSSESSPGAQVILFVLSCGGSFHHGYIANSKSANDI